MIAAPKRLIQGKTGGHELTQLVMDRVGVDDVDPGCRSPQSAMGGCRADPGPPAMTPNAGRHALAVGAAEGRLVDPSILT
jgi:hypothetical protein